MTRYRSLRPIVALAVGSISLVVCSTAVALAPSWRNLVGTDLLRLYDATSSNAEVSTAAPAALGRARVDGQGRVHIDVSVDCTMAPPTPALSAAGLGEGWAVQVPPFCVVEGWAAPRQLPGIAAVAGVRGVALPAYAKQKVPSSHINEQHVAASIIPQASTGTTQTINGNAIAIMRADKFVTQTGANGTAITVGVMSGDATNLSVIQQRSELPAVTVVLPNAGATPNPSPTDEGTMMLEEVHAVAPGASLAFCGPYTGALYIGCLQQLIAAGATIIVDDLQYPSYDAMSSNNPFTQAVQSLLAQNSQVALFSITENYNNSYWQGAYAPTSLASLGDGPLTCALNGQVDSYVQNFNGEPGNALTVKSAGTFPFWIQWADTFGENVSNFDVYTFNPTTGTGGCVFSATGSANTYLLQDTQLDAGTNYFYIATPDASLAGKFLKVFAGGDGLTSLLINTPGSIVSPQTFAQGVNLTGAVNGSDGIGNTIETYSGRGPITLPLSSTQQIAAPSFVAPDAVYVDAQGTDFVNELSNGLFIGTSAAAPNAAAVAALIRSAFPSLTPAQVTAVLQSGATQLGTAKPDSTYGYGRVDAIGALGAIPSPAITKWGNISVIGGTTSTSSSFTVTGTGNLSINVQSSNATLIPGTFVAAGTAGVTVTPANCGQGSTACSISFTPSAGQVGSANITLTVSDGAQRTATATATVTVTKPAPPTIVITGGGSQTVNANSAISPITFTLTGTQPLAVAAGGAASVTLSSGCGTTTLTCTATPGNSAGSAGTQQITLSVQDPYSQSASANASISVNAAASKSGGGSTDLWTLLSLGLLAIYRPSERRASLRRRS
jgi:hypothetical protein